MSDLVRVDRAGKVVEGGKPGRQTVTTAGAIVSQQYGGLFSSRSLIYRRPQIDAGIYQARPVSAQR